MSSARLPFSCAGVTRPWLYWPILVGTAYVATRLIRIEGLPIFLDEALHITAARTVLLGDWSAGFEQGKGLAIAAYAGWFSLFGDSLRAARLLAVALGAAVVAVLATEDDNGKHTIPFAALLYVIFPAAVFYDRLALTDQFVSLGAALTIRCARVAMRRNRTADWISLFAVLVITPLFKYSGALLLLFPFTIYLLEKQPLAFELRRSVLAGYLAVCAFVGICTFHLASLSVRSFVRSPSLELDWLRSIGGNLGDAAGLLLQFATPVFIISLVLGLAWAIPRSNRRRWLLANLLLTIVFVLPLLLLARQWYPRYLLPALVPFCLAAGEVMRVASQARPRLRAARWSLAAGFAFPLLACGALSSQYVLRPARAEYPPLLRQQYLSGWASGSGLREMIAAIQRLSENGSPITVLRLPLADQTLQGLSVFHAELGPGVRLAVCRSWQPDLLAQELREWSTIPGPLYLLLNDTYFVSTLDLARQPPMHPFLFRRVAFFPRPGSDRGLALWQIIPPGTSAAGILNAETDHGR